MCGEVVASHGSIHVRARGWCDNEGVSVKDGKMANCLELKINIYTFLFEVSSSKIQSKLSAYVADSVVPGTNVFLVLSVYR